MVLVVAMSVVNMVGGLLRLQVRFAVWFPCCHVHDIGAAIWIFVACCYVFTPVVAVVVLFSKMSIHVHVASGCIVASIAHVIRSVIGLQYYSMAHTKLCSLEYGLILEIPSYSELLVCQGSPACCF